MRRTRSQGRGGRAKCAKVKERGNTNIAFDADMLELEEVTN